MLAKLSKGIFGLAAQSAWLNRVAKRWGLRFGASQVVAGDSIESAIQKIKELNEQGLVCTLNHLGEYVKSRSEALEATEWSIKTLTEIANHECKSQLSVKLTQLGLDIDQSFCADNLQRILGVAQQTKNFVTIDMEDYTHCQMTLDIVKDLEQKYRSHVGTVIQSYLYRAKQDVKDLKDMNLRLVKGAYQESGEVAYQTKVEIDQNLLKLVQSHLLSGSYTAIASHDHRIIEQVKAFAKEKQIPVNQFEFQMLYGFRTEMQLSLLKEGYTIRVYVPFGSDWFGYFMRRLAERPQNVAFALKGFFAK